MLPLFQRIPGRGGGADRVVPEGPPPPPPALHGPWWPTAPQPSRKWPGPSEPCPGPAAGPYRRHTTQHVSARWGGAIRAERVHRWVLPGVRACAPFEEGILHSWMEGMGVHPLACGVEGAGQPNSQGTASLLDERGWPLGVPPMPAPAFSTRSLSWDWSVLAAPSDVGNATQARGLRITEWYPSAVMY